MVRNAPKVWPILNLPLQSDAGFFGMATLCNLGEDSPDGVSLRLPKAWGDVKGVLSLTPDGSWEPVPFSKEADGVRVCEELRYLEPTVLKFL